MDDGPGLAQVTRDVARLQSQVQGLREALFRISVTVCLSLLLLGLVLPAWHDVLDEKPVTVRVATAGFQYLAVPESGDGQIALGIGFLGLGVVVLLLAGLLLFSVLADMDPDQGRLLRGAIGTLAVVGTAVAVLLSLIVAGSDATGTSGGWGAVVLMVGVALSLVLLGNRSLREGR